MRVVRGLLAEVSSPAQACSQTRGRGAGGGGAGGRADRGHQSSNGQQGGEWGCGGARPPLRGGILRCCWCVKGFHPFASLVAFSGRQAEGKMAGTKMLDMSARQHVKPGRRNRRIQPRGQWDHTRGLTSLQGRAPLYVMKNYGRPEKLGAIDYFQASKVAGVAVLRGSLATSASVPCVVLGIVKWPVADSQIPPIPRILRALLGRSALAARMCGLMCTMHAPSGTPRLLCVVAWAAGRLQCPRC